MQRFCLRGPVIAFAAITLAVPADAGARIAPATASVADIEKSLDSQLPVRMTKAHVPGLSIVVLKDGKIALAKAYGVANAWSGRPLSPDTPFDTASIGKVVPALIAMQFVQEGKLDLDRSLNSYLKRPYLNDGPWRDEVTARTVLTHSSGLPNRVWEHVRDLKFRPSTTFSYSGNGIIYLAEVLSTISGKPFTQLARERVFAPLGMKDSGFVSAPTAVPQANPHMPLGGPLNPYLNILFKYCLPVALLLALILNRSVTGAWRPRWWTLAGAGTAAVAASLQPFVHIFGLSAIKMWLPLGGAVLVLMALGLTLAVVISKRIPGHRVGWAATLGSGLLLGGGCVWLAAVVLEDKWIPLPVRYDRHPIAATTFRSTAPDLARMARELARPKLLAARSAELMRAPQISVDDRIAWGVGIGIQMDPHGNTLWQWGDNPGSQSLMVVNPISGDGVAIVTNSSNGISLARAIAGELLGVEPRWAFD